MLKNIRLVNFKSIRDLDLSLDSVNVFIGQNGTGKSSIAQSIALLKQSKDKLTWDGDFFNFEKFENVLNNQTLDEEIIIGFEGRLPAKKIHDILDIRGIEYNFEISITKDGVSEIVYDLYGNEIIKFRYDMKRTSTMAEKTIGFKGIQIRVAPNFSLGRFIQIRGGSHTKKTYEEYDKIHNALDEFLDTYHRQLDDCKFIFSTRGFDQASYQILDEVSEIKSSRGVTRQAEMTATSMAHNFQIQDKVNELAKKVIPDVQIQVRNLPQKRIGIFRKDEYGEYGLTNEGFGLNQSIFLFIQLALAKEHSTIFIDEPEISLHPEAQSKLASVLIDESVTENKQLIITTHSEHILLGILEAVMEKKISPRRIKVFYFEKTKGRTKVSSLKIEEDGRIIGGMKGFFEADLEHFDRFLESVKKK